MTEHGPRYEAIRACLDGQPFAWQRLVDTFAPYVLANVQGILSLQAVPNATSSPDQAETEPDPDWLVRRVFTALRDDNYHLLRACQPDSDVEAFLAIVTRRVLAGEGQGNASGAAVAGSE